MNWYWVFYFLMILDNVLSALTFVFWLCIALSFFSCIFWGITSAEGIATEGDKKIVQRAKWLLKRCVIVGFSTILLATFIPSRKDIIIIITGGAVGNFISSDSSIQALPADASRYLHNFMNREIEDLKQSKDSLVVK